MGERNPLYTYFEAEKQKHLDAVKEVTARATAEARDTTDDEKDAIGRHMASAAEFQEKMQNIVNAEALDAQVDRLGSKLATEPVPSRADAKTWGEAFVRSEVYAGMKAVGFSGEWTTPDMEFRGSVGDPLLPQTGNNDDAIQENFVRQLETPGLRQEQLTLASLFTEVQVGEGTGPVVRYPILTTRTAADGGVVDPGEAKPYAEYAFDDATVTLAKRAAFVAIAEEMMTDAPYVAAFINSDLPFMVQQAEEAAFTTAFYAAVTEFATAGGITGGTNVWDAILAGVTDVRMNFFAEPDGLFIHPLDWAAAMVSKANTSGNYFSGGPNGSPSTNLWGTPARVVISQRAVQGFPIVGAFKLGGKVYRKGNVRLRASTSHADFFQKNLVAILAELRSALGITYPEAFAKIDLAS